MKTVESLDHIKSVNHRLVCFLEVDSPCLLSHARQTFEMLRLSPRYRLLLPYILQCVGVFFCQQLYASAFNPVHAPLVGRKGKCTNSRNWTWVEAKGFKLHFDITFNCRVCPHLFHVKKKKGRVGCNVIQLSFVFVFFFPLRVCVVNSF